MCIVALSTIQREISHTCTCTCTTGSRRVEEDKELYRHFPPAVHRVNPAVPAVLGPYPSIGGQDTHVMNNWRVNVFGAFKLFALILCHRR